MATRTRLNITLHVHCLCYCYSHGRFRLYTYETAATDDSCVHPVNMDAWIWTVGGNGIDMGTGVSGKKSLCQCQFVPYISHTNWPGIRWEKPASSILRYSLANYGFHNKWNARGWPSAVDSHLFWWRLTKPITRQNRIFYRVSFAFWLLRKSSFRYVSGALLSTSIRKGAVVLFSVSTA